jgi:hypothetical protein
VCVGSSLPTKKQQLSQKTSVASSAFSLQQPPRGLFLVASLLFQKRQSSGFCGGPCRSDLVTQ